MHQIIITTITAVMISYPHITITTDPHPCQHGADVIIIKKMYMVMTYTLLNSSIVLTTKVQDTDITTVLCIQSTGRFGWTGTPAAFQVITRGIAWELRRTLAG